MAALVVASTSATAACRLSPALARHQRTSIAASPALRSLALPRRMACRASAKKEEVTPSAVEVSERDAFESSGFWEKAVLTVSAMATPMLLAPEASFAKDGEFGLLEGRSAALLHPAIMFVLFASTVYAGYLGFQWRRLREVGTQISELKKQVPEGPAGETSPVAAEVAKLTAERKSLAEGGYRDKHWLVGSWLLFAGVGIAVEGCVNTYMRTGRLFPGPHLYAGAIITVLWAAAAALVPAMQKGNETARTAHIALNVANVLLFVSQIPTGLEIVDKVFQFTSWP